MKFSDILKEGIPIYGEYESNINKKMLERLKSYYKNTPEYILNDIFNTNIKQHTMILKKIIIMILHYFCLGLMVVTGIVS